MQKQQTSGQKHQGILKDSVGEYDIIDCEECGFIHATPIPSPEELKTIYQHEYYVDDKPLYIERFIEDLEWWKLAYGDRYDTFEALLPEGARRLLDIGSGPGYFLKHGQDRGWDVLGVEPSQQAQSHSTEVLGVNVLQKEFNREVASEIGSFDVIHLSEVLEHIPDPKYLLENAYQILAKNGLVCVVVPNDYNPLQEALRAGCGFEPWWLAPPHHINYFTFDSLSVLLEKCGFHIVLKEATFPIDLFLLMGIDYIGDDKIGRKCHEFRKQFELNMSKANSNSIKREMYRSFAKNNIGREIILIAEKDV